MSTVSVKRKRQGMRKKQWMPTTPCKNASLPSRRHSANAQLEAWELERTAPKTKSKPKYPYDHKPTTHYNPSSHPTSITPAPAPRENTFLVTAKLVSHNTTCMEGGRKLTKSPTAQSDPHYTTSHPPSPPSPATHTATAQDAPAPDPSASCYPPYPACSPHPPRGKRGC
jgi:hypothetical protein